jgi:hypothetical protein
MPAKAIFLSIVLALGPGCTLATAQVQQPAEDLSRKIVYNPHSPGLAEFIPEALLQANERANLTGLRDLESLEMRIAAEAQRLARGEKRDCMHGSEGATRPYAVNGIPMIEILRNTTVVSVGTVVDVVVGWGRGEVRTLVWIEVDEIIQCLHSERDFSVKEKGLLAVVARQGETVVDGVSTCNATEEVVVPPVGSRVIVGGAPIFVGSPYIGHGWIFRVFRDQILPQPYEDLSPRVPMPYETILKELGPSTDVCEGSVP